MEICGIENDKSTQNKSNTLGTYLPTKHQEHMSQTSLWFAVAMSSATPKNTLLTKMLRDAPVHHCYTCGADLGGAGPKNAKLVGGFNPFENISQIGSSPQIGWKLKKRNHHLVR